MQKITINELQFGARVLRDPGTGRDFATGETVEVSDTNAERLIKAGYATAAPAKSGSLQDKSGQAKSAGAQDTDSGGSADNPNARASKGATTKP